jgi:hypothetical protein
MREEKKQTFLFFYSPLCALLEQDGNFLHKCSVEKKDSIRGKEDREEDCTLYRRLISSLASCSIHGKAFNLCSFIRNLIV